jgi:hypothetical protein
MTPNFAVVGVDAPGFHWPRIWLPIFLLWIPAIVVAPFVLLVLAVVCLAARVSFFRTIWVAWGILTSLPGTDVRVQADGTNVLVRIL